MKRKISFLVLFMLGFAAIGKAQTVKQTGITPITDALVTINKLNPVIFNYEQEWAEKLKLKATPQHGFSLDELLKNTPGLVLNQQLNYTEGKNNTKNVTIQKIDYEALLPLLVGSIKEQQKQIEALKAEIAALREKTSK